MAERHNALFPFYTRSLSTMQKTVGVDLEKVLLQSASAGGNRFYDELVMLYESDRERTITFLKRMVAGMPNPIKLAHIAPYNVFIPDCSRTDEAVLRFVVRRQADDLKEIRDYLRIGVDNRIDAYVVVYDYQSILSSLAYMDKQGYAVLESPDGMLTYTDSVIPDAWWKRLNDLKPISIDSILTGNSVTSAVSDDFELMFVDESLSDKTLAELQALNAQTSKDKSLNIDYVGESGGKAVEYTLETMLLAQADKMAGVPVLAGLSGVAKSAIVKNVAKKYGWRMVDFRAAFLHRLDMEGLQYLANADSTEFYSYQDYDVYEKFTRSAYFSDFVKCSDQYIEFAKKMADKLRMVKSAGPNDELYLTKEKMLEDGTYADIDTTIKHYEDEAKPVVLFFDEIIRAPLKIMNLFTILLDSKEIGPLKFANTKIVAAANTPHGMTDMQSGADIFVGQEITDPAIHERLKIITVTPGDVYPGWLDYIKDKGWDQDVIDYVSQGVQFSYGLDVLNDTNLTSEQKGEAIYPTFRAWEQVSGLLARARNTAKPLPIFPEQILGLLGEKHGHPFVEYLKKKNFVFGTESPSGAKSDDDPMLTTLDSNLEAGVPTGLFGPSGLGKTARIKRLVASKPGWELIVIQLSQKSLGDIMGAPTLTSAQAFQLGDFASTVGPKMTSHLLGMAGDSAGDVQGLPSMVTQRAPDGAILDAIRRLRQNRAAQEAANENLPPEKQLPLPKLVLFFDECNRFTEINISVQSAMFDAISDHRFAGVQFDPDEVVVVAAANVKWAREPNSSGEDDPDDDLLSPIYGDKKSYEGTQPMDAALRLRLCSIDKKSIDLSDAIETRGFITKKSSDFHPVVKKYFESLTDHEILLLMKSVEYKSEQRNVPSIRSFQSLSGCLATSPEDFSGAFFFPTPGSRQDFAEKIQSNPLALVDFLRDTNVQSRWVCMKHPDQCKISAAVPADTLPELLEMVKDIANMSPADLATISDVATKVLAEVFSLESKVKALRVRLLESFLGTPDSTKDLRRQNRLVNVIDGLERAFAEAGSAGSMIDYPDIVDQATADIWVRQVMREEKLPERLSDIMHECFAYHLNAKSFSIVSNVIVAGFTQAEANVYQVVLDLLWPKTDFVKYDAEMAAFNKAIVAAVQAGKQKSLGAEWDKAIATI